MIQCLRFIENMTAGRGQEWMGVWKIQDWPCTGGCFRYLVMAQQGFCLKCSPIKC